MFSEETLRLAWAWAARRCACKRDSHGHTDRCERDVAWRRRGVRGSGGWEAHHRLDPAEGGRDEPENCEILCWACHMAVASAAGKEAAERRPEPPALRAGPA